MAEVRELAPQVGVMASCNGLGVARSTFYRDMRPGPPRPKKPRPSPARALSIQERLNVLDALHSERFIDLAPAEVYYTLLGEGAYHCSIRTMYRILEVHDEVRERRNQLSHPHYQKPELLATGPNQVWSWDITRLL